MGKSKLMKVSYRDIKEGISLLCYADTIAYTSQGALAAIRFGGYPEMVRALSDAIYGGGTVEVDDGTQTQRLQPLIKQYKRQLSNDGVYAEAMLIANDDEVAAKQQSQEDVAEEQQQMTLPPRTAYIFCPQGDEDLLFDEIDRKVSVPLIPAYKEFLLETLIDSGILEKLQVWSCALKFDAWALRCSEDDQNLIQVLEDGLQSGAIKIPGAASESKISFPEIEGVTQYLREFGVSIANRIKTRFLPLFDPAAEPLSAEIHLVNDNIREQAGYPLYNAQLACAEALKRKILQRQPAIIVAECGSGKTKIGATALHAAHVAEGLEKSFNIVMCPSHVTEKWVREIEESVSNSFAGVIRSINELQLFYAAYERSERTAFAVISKEKARDGYMRVPSVFWNKRKKAFLCPHCYTPVEMDIIEDGSKYRDIADSRYFPNENSANHKCETCDEVLWSPLEAQEQSEWVRIGEYGYVHRLFCKEHLSTRKVKKSRSIWKKIMEVARNPEGHFIARSAYRGFPISTYIKKHMQGKIHGFIADELHQFAKDSGQGDAMGEIAAVADKMVGMTATLINGYSSGIFYLLWRLFSRYMVLDFQKHEEPKRFDNEYGVSEITYDLSQDEAYNSTRCASKRKIKERLLPGVSPLVYSRYLLENAVFLSLMDMGKALPEYEEFAIPLHMDAPVQKQYRRLQESIQSIMTGDRKIARKIQSTTMNLLTVYPDQPYNHPPIMHPLLDGNVLLTAQDAGGAEDISPKDQKVLELVKNKIENGGLVLIYTSWVRIDTQDKLKKLLDEAGYRVAVLPNTVRPQRRESWVENAVVNGVQVLITNPSLVETGLDLNDFTTLIYYNIGYNLFTLRQSSRRSWRINQTAPRIEVYFLFYQNTIQERALHLMASKLAVAGLIEGQVTDEGLAAMSDCRDLTSELARELTRGIRDEVEDISAVFKKMAFLKSDSEKQEFVQTKTMLADPKRLPEVPVSSWQDTGITSDKTAVPKETQPVLPLLPHSETANTFVFCAPKRTRTAVTVQVEDQLSLFDQSA